jgi:hypothetical protein
MALVHMLRAMTVPPFHPSRALSFPVDTSHPSRVVLGRVRIAAANKPPGSPTPLPADLRSA